MQSSQLNRTSPSRPNRNARNQAESQKKSVFKTYNTMFHNFDYEQAQKHKNTFVEVYNEKSTPSDISHQSIFENNSDIFQMIPALRELLNLAECESDEVITYSEYCNMLFKLKVKQACEGLTGPSKYFEFRSLDHRIKVEEFVAFFTSDIQHLELQRFSLEELVLKIGLEIYRAVSKENISLELKHLVNYMKEHKKLDIDMTSILDIFDFFMDPNQGVLKSKTSLVSFFQKNAIKLARALNNEFLRQIQNMQNKKTDDLMTSRRDANISEMDSKIPNIIKVYDANARSNIKNKPQLLEITPLPGHKNERQQEERERGLQINLETRNFLDVDAQFLNNMEIAEVFQEILPKNRGWIMRKSNRHENKWSMVFFEVLDGKLISTKPTNLKKSIPVRNIEIHKCNFLEIIKRIEPSQSDSRKGHKRNDSNTKTLNTRTNLPTKAEKERQDYLFFIVDKTTHKTYLIKSPDNTLIGSIIHFYVLKENPNRPDAQGFQQLLNNDPEYSGVIEIAVCKKTSINKYHSSLKPYTFKKQFLVIKHGRFNIFEMKIKDNLDLLDYEAKINSNDDFFPQTNQYIFSLEKSQNGPYSDLVGKVPHQSNLMSIHENYAPPTDMGYYLSPKSKRLPTLSNTNPNYEDLKIVEYRTPQNKGFFSSILKKIQPSKKKEHKVIMACDTELKRRQWVLTLKFFSQIAQNNMYRSLSKESAISYQDDFRTSFQNEAQPTITDHAEARNKPKKKKQSSVSFKPKPTYNPDFLDVYKTEEKEANNEEQNEKNAQIEAEHKQNPSKKSLPLMTEPDASHRLDSEEILMTFTQFNPDNFPFVMTKNNTLGNRIMSNFEPDKLLVSNEIKSMSEIEIWQKFLMFFMQENHACSEFDLTNESEVNNTQFGSPSRIGAMEEDVSIREVIISDFNIKNQM